MRRSALPSLSEFRAQATHALRAAGLDEPQHEASFLLAGVLGMDRTVMLAQSEHALTTDEQARLTAALVRRGAGEPLARILGAKEFWGLNFDLNAATLVPRPDSETLIETALEYFPDKQAPLHVLDLGTGSGCLLLSVLHELPQATGLGIDVAPDAVTQAAANADRLGLAARTAFMVADWHEANFIKQLPASPFDLILSNPPYIATPVIRNLQREVRDHDPALALDGGADGLAAYRRLAELLPLLLTLQGIAILEIGYDQGETVLALCRAAGFTPTLRHDLAGQPRCVILKRASTKDS